jgi:CsoR family transcriptional regulator, copper-sensing transcriptional repressor
MDGEKPKKDVLLRLRKIEGQLRGLQRMVEENVPCPEIMTQVAAVTSGVKKVGMVIVQTYMEECLSRTEKASEPKRSEALKDLKKAISQYIDWA